MKNRSGSRMKMAMVLLMAIVLGIPWIPAKAETFTKNNLPNTLASASVKWPQNTNTVTDYTDNQMTNPVLLDKSLFAVSNGVLKKYDPETGKEMTGTVPEADRTANNFYFPFLESGKVNGKDALFLLNWTKATTTSYGYTYSYQTTPFTVKAYDTDMNLLWTSEAFTAGGSQSALTYANGHIYGMLNQKTDAMFCLNADNGTVLWKKDATKAGKNNGYDSYGGNYAKPLVVGNYVIFGGEGARLEAYTADGTLVSSMEAQTADNIRSAMTYQDGAIYFTSADSVSGYTSTAAYIHKVIFDAASGNFGTETATRLSSDAINATSKPAVYNGRVYAGGTNGTDSEISIFNVSDLSCIYTIKNAGTQKTGDIVLVSDPTDSSIVYGYTTYYNNPGSVLCFKDTAARTAQESDSVIDFGSITGSVSKQYGGSQLYLADDGTIYFSNEAGVLTALTGTFQKAVQTSAQTGTSSVSAGSTVADSTAKTSTKAAAVSAKKAPDTADTADAEWPVLGGMLLLATVLLTIGFRKNYRKRESA